jgi:signal transduction histidine kinase
VQKATIPDEDTNPAAPPKQVVIIYASPTRELQHRIFNIGWFALGSGFLLLVCTGFLASRGVQTGLAPLEVLVAEASHVSPSNWQIKVPESIRTTKELAPLVITLDATLAGLQRAFSRERDFVADAAHELKTAVAILKSSLQIFSYQLTAKQQYQAGVIRCFTDCDRLEALVFSMLSLARAEQRAEQGQSEEFPTVDLLNSCERAIADLHSIAESRNIQINLTADIEPTVKADPDDLHTVWVNLLHNALQHSQIGSAISVSIKIGAAAATAQIVVKDFGSGIPPKHLPHVFDRFYRGDPSRSRDTGGFGLGLSISKAIIELYRGKIYLESNASGTSACVSLPVHDVAASNPTAGPPAVLNHTEST